MNDDERDHEYVQRGAQSLGEAVYTELQARSQTEHGARHCCQPARPRR